MEGVLGVGLCEGNEDLVKVRLVLVQVEHGRHGHAVAVNGTQMALLKFTHLPRKSYLNSLFAELKDQGD